MGGSSMQLRWILSLLLFYIVGITTPAAGQITSFPYTENFDGVAIPGVPLGWSVSGFVTYSSSPHSVPNCVSATGNRSQKMLMSPVFDFSGRLPDKLKFFEKRTGSASTYRMEVRVSTNGIDFETILARFDTITSTTSYIQRIIDLSTAGLQNQSNVQFRWIILADSTNNTGILRFDDITIDVAIAQDVGLIRFDVTPQNATRINPLSLLLQVKNYGIQAASNSSLQLYIDENCNGITEQLEEVAKRDINFIKAGDSLETSFEIAPLPAGEHRFIAVVNLSNDENRKNDTARSRIVVGNVLGDLLINEIMYAPVEDEPEWIELYNASSDIVNLKNWRISDNNVQTKSFITQSDIYLRPDSFVVIVKDTLSNNTGFRHIVANFSALNNTTQDAVVIFDASFNTIDSVSYYPSWGGKSGTSLERIELNSYSTSQENWRSSEDSLGSTPGQINSIARRDYDIEISSLKKNSLGVGEDYIPELTFSVRNVGKLDVDTLCIQFYSNSDRSGLVENSELLCEKIVIHKLTASDSVEITEALSQIRSGETNVIVYLNWWCDNRLRNNSASILVRMGYEPHSLVINEFIFDPLEGQNEWIELYNRSAQPIDSKFWTINDRPTTSGENLFTISQQSTIVQPGSILIVSADSSIFNLFPYLRQPDSPVNITILNKKGGFGWNSEGDQIVLKDLTQQTIDSIEYSTRWHHPDILDTKGRSLERINPAINTNDPRNWSTCTKLIGGTPGMQNSVHTSNTQTKTRISLTPNPFSPDGDGYQDFCSIQYNLKLMTSMVSIRIYDIKGRLVRTLSNREVIGSQGEIIWDGLDDRRQKVRIGVYIIYLEASEFFTGKNETAKAVAVVATKL
jgi:hypothetical protein